MKKVPSHHSYERIVILTGAGISAESGLGTFRDKEGLWTKYAIEDVATPEAFERDPGFVHEFYNLRRANLKNAKANAAHEALCLLEKQSKAQVLLVTQNVDNLHEQAGSENLLHMHGELQKVRCSACRAVHYWPADLSLDSVCPVCEAKGALRPHVVWFGEMPHHMTEIMKALSRCDLFISIGTSGNVYPAAGFVQEANLAGAHTVELNLEPSEGETLFSEKHYGPASEVVPSYVEALLTK